MIITSEMNKEQHYFAFMHQIRKKTRKIEMFVVYF